MYLCSGRLHMKEIRNKRINEFFLILNFSLSGMKLEKMHTTL